MSRAIFIPKWVVALADDHIASLQMIYDDIAECRRKIQAIELRQRHGIFSDGINFCLDVSVTKSMPINAKALTVAYESARNENERLEREVESANDTLLKSMSSTLDMMHRMAAKFGGKLSSDEEISTWIRWFSKRLHQVIKQESLKLRTAEGEIHHFLVETHRPCYS